MDARKLWGGLKRTRTAVYRSIPSLRFFTVYNVLTSIAFFYFLIAFATLASDGRQIHPNTENEIPQVFKNIFTIISVMFLIK